MKRLIVGILIVLSVILISIGSFILLGNDKKDKKEDSYSNNIKLSFISHDAEINSDKIPFYKDLKTKEFSIRTMEPNDIEISFLSNEESIEYFTNHFNKMYFNSSLKVEAGSFYDNAPSLLKEIQEKYDLEIYLKKNVYSGKTKINNYDVEYFKVVNERKEDIDIYEEIFYIIIYAGENTRVEIKYIVVNSKFNISTLENLINNIKITKLKNIYNSTLNNDVYTGKLVFDKNNNPNKGDITYEFKKGNLVEELSHLSAPFSVIFENKEEKKLVNVYLTDEEIETNVNKEINNIKSRISVDIKEEKKSYNVDVNMVRLKYNIDGKNKESVILYKKITERINYIVIFQNYNEVSNIDIDNFLNIKTK